MNYVSWRKAKPGELYEHGGRISMRTTKQGVKPNSLRRRVGRKLYELLDADFRLHWDKLGLDVQELWCKRADKLIAMIRDIKQTDG